MRPALLRPGIDPLAAPRRSVPSDPPEPTPPDILPGAIGEVVINATPVNGEDED